MIKYRLIPMNIGLALATIACACTPPPEVQSAPIRPPKSLVELLANIRLVTDSGAILQDDFYTEDNLRRAYGAGTVAFRAVSCAVNTIPDLKDFPAWLPRVGRGDKTYAAFDLRTRRYTRLDGRQGTWVILTSPTTPLSDLTSTRSNDYSAETGPSVLPSSPIFTETTSRQGAPMETHASYMRYRRVYPAEHCDSRFRPTPFWTL